MGILAKLAFKVAPIVESVPAPKALKEKVATSAKATKMKFAPPPNDGKIRLNLGSGDKNLEGYTNVDVVESRGDAKPDVLCDLRKLSFPNDHADEIISIHVIEHFYEWEVQGLLKEWMRVLKPGGTLTLECPNLMYAVQMIVEDETRLLDEGKNGWMLTMYSLYGNPREEDPYMCHRWGWTPTTLAAELIKAGYNDAHEEPARFKKGNPRDMRVVATKPAR